MTNEPDFLSLNATAEAREVQRQKALEVAKLYTVFTTDPRGQQLLAMWDEQLARQRTPVNATIQEYAANEAVRTFVEGIRTQIRFATTEGR